MHHNAHRFSIEWSRVEPRDGVFDRDELRHYRDVVRTCRALGHGAGGDAAPLHAARVAGRPRRGAAAATRPDLFARFAAACAEALGADVRWWVTINEPGVLAVFGYLYGEWPPLQPSMRGFLGALGGHGAHARRGVHAAMHAGGARARVARPMVSIAHHERPLRPADPRSRARSRRGDPAPTPSSTAGSCAPARRGRLLPPVGHGQPVPGLRGSLDYLGLNYYCEERVRFACGAAASSSPRASCRPGAAAVGLRLDHRPRRPAPRPRRPCGSEFRLPILITENGVADDARRAAAAVPRRPPRRRCRRHRRGRRRPRLPALDVAGQLRVGRGVLQALRPLRRRPRHHGAHAKPSAAVYAEICRTRRVAAARVDC